MTSPLHIEASKWRILQAKLFADMPDLEHDEQTLHDTLEGLTEIHEMLAEVIRSALLDEAMLVGIDAVAAKLTDRKAAMKARAVKKRETVRHMMEDLGIKRLTPPDMTVTRAATAQGVQVINIDALPLDLVKIKREADKTAIKAALKEGRDVPGACLSNAGETLKVTI